MVKECVKFAACYKSAVAAKPSGVDEDLVIQLATGLFNGAQMARPTDHPGKQFRFLAAWKVLRVHPKFLHGDGDDETITKKRTESSSAATPSSATLDSDDCEENTPVEAARSSSARAVGRKRAKDDKLKLQLQFKKVKPAEATLQSANARNEALARHNEILLFTQGPGGASSEELKEFFTLLRAEALTKARKRLQDSTDSPNPPTADVAAAEECHENGDSSADHAS